MTATDGSGPPRTLHPAPAAPSPGPQRSPRPLPAAPRAPLPRGRRRPALLALGVVLVVLGILGGVWLVRAAGERVAVLAVARPVPYGAVLTAGDLTRAEVSVDPAVATVPAGDLDQVLGLVAATNLTPGSLLTRSAVTRLAPPGPGQVLVAIALPAGRLPAGPLRAGDPVLVVDTPPAGAEPPTLPPATIAATVVRLAPPDPSGVTVVDVTVNAGDGPALAARSATGRIAVVVLSRGR